MSTITIVVGNVGTVLETTDAKEASDIYRHYCDASDAGSGRMARENVTMLSNRGDADDIVAEHVGYNARLEAMDDGTFMLSSITAKTSWYMVEHDNGCDYVECSVIGDLPGLANIGDMMHLTDPDDVVSPAGQRSKEIRDACRDYVDTPNENIINSIERIEGCGARLSAPG